MEIDYSLIGKRIMFINKKHSLIPYGTIGIVKKFQCSLLSQSLIFYDVEFEGGTIKNSRENNTWLAELKEFRVIGSREEIE